MNVFAPSYIGPWLGAEAERAADLIALTCRTSSETSVGSPPKTLQRFHHSAEVHQLWLQLMQAIRLPVSRSVVAGVVQVRVIGGMVFSVHDDGRISASRWHWDGRESPRLVEVNPAEISLFSVPTGWRWLENLIDAFGRHMAGRLGIDFAEVAPYAQWLLVRFQRLIRHHCDLREMRRRVQAALALDPFVLRIAHQLRRSIEPLPLACIDTYNHVLAYRAAYQRLASEAPSLIPLYAVFAADAGFDPNGQPAQQLKLHLSRRGIQPKAWRMLCASNGRLIKDAFEFYCGATAPAIQDFLHVLQLLGFAKQPPAWFVRELMSLFGMHEQRHFDYLPSFVDYATPLRRIALLLERAADDKVAAMRPDMHAVLSWVVDSPEVYGITRATFRRASWNWFAMKGRQWRERARLTALARQDSWPVSLPPYSVGPLQAVVLGSALALWEEGEMMHHCAATYEADCRTGKTAVLSLRRPGEKRPVATVLAVRKWQRYELKQAAGPVNHPLPLATKRLAEKAVAELNQRLRAKKKRPVTRSSTKVIAAVVNEAFTRAELEDIATVDRAAIERELGLVWDNEGPEAVITARAKEIWEGLQDRG